MEQSNGRIIVTLASKDREFTFEELRLNFESTDQEILDALSPIILEEEGLDIKEEQSEGYYTIRRAENSGNIYLFPKSIAG